MAITPVDGSGTTPTTTPTQYVTITQPDGTKYRVPMTQAKWDAEAKKWTASPSAEATTVANQINQKYNAGLTADDFMKLLVAQMKYQDPSKPMDSAAMMQQSASMSMIQTVNEMSASVDKLADAATAMEKSQTAMGTSYATMLMEQRMSSAVGLVGRTVTYADKTDPDTKIEGVVDSVRFDTTGPILSVGGKDVPLASVSSVKNPAGSSASSSSSTGTTTGSTTGV